MKIRHLYYIYNILLTLNLIFYQKKKKNFKSHLKDNFCFIKILNLLNLIIQKGKFHFSPLKYKIVANPHF